MIIINYLIVFTSILFIILEDKLLTIKYINSIKKLYILKIIITILITLYYLNLILNELHIIFKSIILNKYCS